MPIQSVNVNNPGQTGVVPQIVYIETNDTLATVLTAGYLNHIVAEGIPLSTSTIALVSTKTSPQALQSSTQWLQITHSGNNWSLLGGGSVSSVLGTANQITASNSSGVVTLAIANNPILPGTAGVTIPQGNTAARAGSAGTMRLNTQTNVFEGTVDGSTWATFQSSSIGVTSITGTTNRLTVSPTTGAAVADISAAYIGQSSITTLGTVTTGTWNGAVIAGTYGGTGINNGGSTITIGGNFAISGGFTFAGTLTGNTAITFPTSGTLASTSQIPSLPVSLSNGGTGASLTASNGGIFYSTASAGAILGGTPTASQLLLSGSSSAPSWSTSTYPSTNAVNTLLYASSANTMAALATANNGVLVTNGTGVPSIGSTLPSAVQLNITSLGTITTGLWNGSTIGPAFGGTGVNNGTSTITVGGNFAMSGAFTFTGTVTANTTLTFPTSGTLATVGQLPTLPLSLSNGGTGASLTASNGGIFYSNASTGAILAGTATAGQLLTSGAAGAPSWTTSTYPATNAVNTLLYASSANTMAALATANNGVLVTNGTGVPSIGSTLPSAVQSNITALGTIASGVWNGTAITVGNGGTGNTTFTAYSVICAGTTATGLFQNVSGVGTAGQVLTSNGAAALPSWQPAGGGGGGIAFTVISGTTQAAVVNSGYIVGNASQTTITLPATAAAGSVISVQGLGAAGWVLTANTGQTINLDGTVSTSGGTCTSANAGDSITVICVTANTTWAVFNVLSSGVTLA